jgi:hypothetical protein
MRLRITAGRLALEAEVRDTPTAGALAAALPFEATAQTWGEEVYFTTPVSAKLEPDAKQVVEPGAVCFWTEGDALALPYGRTPISTDARPKLAARCNVLGRLLGDARALAGIKSGAKIRVERADATKAR